MFRAVIVQQECQGKELYVDIRHNPGNFRRKSAKNVNNYVQFIEYPCCGSTGRRYLLSRIHGYRYNRIGFSRSVVHYFNILSKHIKF